jgi:5-methylcytosine-specific restriction endonuclease McrA
VPRHRPDQELWQELRRLAWERDNRKCTHCGKPVTLETCHTDHIKSGKLATNELKNLRTLCRRCHVLRADNRHRGMIAKALRDGIIPPNWRELVWEG